MMMTLILIIFLIIAGITINSAWFKGIWGEYKVNSLIENKLDNKSYKLLKDVLLPTEDGTTQVDHIIISKFGIFVIETKNMSNWIFANNGPIWKQVIFKKRYQFQNPVNQNYKHIKTIEKILGDADKILFNTVVFAGDCQFKTDVPKGVVKINRLILHIKSYQEQVLDNKKIREYVDKINNVKLENTIKNKINHISHVETIASGNTKNIWIFDKIIKLFVYKFISLAILLIITFYFIGNISKQSSRLFDKIIHNNQKQQDVIKNQKNYNLNNKNDNLYKSYKIKQIEQKENAVNISETVKQRPQQSNKRVLYSWRDENGQRAFSNIGFPKDGKYSEGKIEWY